MAYVSHKLCLLIFYIISTAGMQCEGKDESKSRGRDHIESMLTSLEKDTPFIQDLPGKLSKLKYIYKDKIQPLSDAYDFHTMGYSQISDGELDAKPMVLFLGPWSAGKTTMINYLAGLNIDSQLSTGAQPLTSDFTVVYHGKRYRKVDGLILANDDGQSFKSLARFGERFLEKFQGVEYPNKLLQKVTLIDTPGIIENNKQQERGYPFNEVCEWFMDRADIIFLVFDPTKLDFGSELESIFNAMQGRESKLRIIFNKADSFPPQELLRVYGSLLWSLEPFINVTEPPKVYIGSFWDKTFKPDTYHDLFRHEERSLLQDLNNIIVNKAHRKIGKVIRRAKAVRLHALLVDQYLKKFEEHQTFFGNDDDVFKSIADNPEKYNIYKSVLARSESEYDLPDPESYKHFFAVNSRHSFKQLYCGMFSECLLENIEDAIKKQLPELLSVIQKESKQ